MTEPPTVIVGAGPTGIATLFYASLEGVPAVGVEAGPTPLPDVHGYLRNLTLLSPSDHYEVADLPLDCRSRFQLTREDVLSYYARLIAFGRLDIRCQHRCVDVEFDGDRKVVHLETPRGVESMAASNVVFTNWLRRRPIPESWLGKATLVVSGIDDVTRFSHLRIAIVGGGLSAFEQAVALMFTGQRVTVVARNKLHRAFRNPQVRRLVAATGSNLIERAEAISVQDTGVRFRQAASDRMVECDVAVACLGREICPDTTAMLLKLGVIDAATGAAVKKAVDDNRGDETDTSRLEPTLEDWPDLGRQLRNGVRGVRIAGGGLHIGSAGAGVKMAILTALLAVQAIKGREFPPFLAASLPKALWDAVVSKRSRETFEWFAARGGSSYDLVEHIRPLAIQSWSRLTIAAPLAPAHADEDTQPAAYVLGRPDLPLDAVADLLATCDGTESLRDIAKEAAISMDDLIRWMRLLWISNALTWLPPPEAAKAAKA